MTCREAARPGLVTRSGPGVAATADSAERREIRSARSYSLVPPLVGIWRVAGIVLYFVLRGRDSTAVERLGDVMTEA